MGAVSDMWATLKTMLMLFLVSHVSFPLATIVAVVLFVYAVGRKILRMSKGLSDEEDGQFRPQSVLITGASSGIGEGLALSYAKDKCTVILFGRDKARLDKVTKACTALGATAIPVIADVTDEKFMSAKMKELDEQYKIDLVIANAGVTGNTLPENMSFEQKTQQILRTNIQGCFNTVLPIIESFKNRGSGQIAMISSLSGLMDFPKSPAYSASKASLITYCRDMRDILRHYNVRVNVVLPGFVRSAMTDARTKRTGSSMPFFWETERAVNYIKAGLRNNESVIAFPFPMYFACYFASVLPPVIQETLHRIANFNKNTNWNRIG